MPESASINVNFSAPPEIRSVTNLAQLRHILSNTITHGDNVLVDGAVMIGDGGGGTFVFDSSNAAPDDNATTIAPDDLGVHPGRWRIIEIAGSADASSVAYGGQYATVRDALDAILYVAPVISGFAATPAIAEQGSTVAQVAFAWSVNKTVTSQVITGLTAITPDARSTTANGPFTADRAWTLAVGDGKNTVNATALLRFQQRRYWGVSPFTSLTGAQVLTLAGSEFATGKSKAVTYDCTGGNYPYFAYPAAWGEPSATVGGLAFSDFVISTQDVTNASGYTSSYKVVRFGNLQNGSAISVQWS